MTFPLVVVVPLVPMSTVPPTKLMPTAPFDEPLVRLLTPVMLIDPELEYSIRLLVLPKLLKPLAFGLEASVSPEKLILPLTVLNVTLPKDIKIPEPPRFNPFKLIEPPPRAFSVVLSFVF